MPDGDRLSGAMSALHDELANDGVSPALVDTFRPLLPELVKHITAQIQGSVGAYAGVPEGRRQRLIDMAVTGGVTHFLEIVAGQDTSGRRVDELFRRMGYGEAADGNNLGPMRAALQVATQDAWEQLRSFAIEHGLSTAALGRLGDALFAYIDHLAEQASIGFEAGVRALDRDSGTAKAQLLAALVDGATPEEVRAHATNAVFSLPESFTVISVAAPVDSEPVELPVLSTKTLMRSAPGTPVVLCDAGETEEVVAALRAHDARLRIAVSWSIPAGQVADARRWTDRALALAESGVIADEPVIDCNEHRTQLWLHSEPALRQRLCQDRLRPLLAETPNSREILSETLLAWLESRDSAPAIAARLGVHPQTVRYRWKRINELFREDLHDPEFVVQVTMLLKASVPLWKAGDQSDFELFRTEDAG